MRLKQAINKDKKLLKKEKKILIDAFSEANSSGGKFLYFFLLILLYGFFILIFYSIFSILNELIGKTILIRLRSIFFFLSTLVLGYLVTPLVKYMQEKIRTGSQAGFIMNLNFKRPILFLRNFKSDVNQGIDKIKVTRRNYYFITETSTRKSIESVVKKDFRKYGPLIALKGYNDNSFNGASRFRVANDNDWKELVIASIKISSIVIVMVGKITESLLWELNELSKLKKTKHTIFYIPPLTDSLTKTKFFEEVKGIFNINVSDVKELKNATYFSDKNGVIQEIDIVNDLTKRINTKWK